MSGGVLINGPSHGQIIDNVADESRGINVPVPVATPLIARTTGYSYYERTEIMSPAGQRVYKYVDDQPREEEDAD